MRVASPPGGGGWTFSLGRIGRQRDLPAIRKFEIAQVDMATAPFNDIASADRKPGRKATDLGTHGILPDGRPPVRK